MKYVRAEFSLRGLLRRNSVAPAGWQPTVHANVRLLANYFRSTPGSRPGCGGSRESGFDPQQTCGDSQALSPQFTQRSIVRRTEMREPPQSGGEPSCTADQPILIKMVNAKLRI